MGMDNRWMDDIHQTKDKPYISDISVIHSGLLVSYLRLLPGIQTLPIGKRI